MVSVEQLVALGVNWVAATNTFERLLRDFIRETNLKSKLKANSSRVEYSLAVFRVERLCRYDTEREQWRQAGSRIKKEV